MLAQRLADIDAARGEEGVGHAAADDQMIDLARPDGRARRAWSRPWRRRPPPRPAARDRRAPLQAPSAPPPSPGRQSSAGNGRALGRGMGAVRGREGVVDVEIAERGHRLGQLGIILLFARRGSAYSRARRYCRAASSRSRAAASGPWQSSMNRTERPASRCSGRTSCAVDMSGRSRPWAGRNATAAARSRRGRSVRARSAASRAAACRR